MHVELRWHKLGGRHVVAKLYVGPERESAELITTLVATPVALNALDRLLTEGARATRDEHAYVSGALPDDWPGEL